jgi:hypothetical protein
MSAPDTTFFAIQRNEIERFRRESGLPVAASTTDVYLLHTLHRLRAIAETLRAIEQRLERPLAALESTQPSAPSVPQHEKQARRK